MKRLFVGCRVRILHSVAFPELIGTEGRIVAESPGITVQGSIADWGVAPDAWGSWHAPAQHLKYGSRFSPQSENLEPILPGGHKPSTMSTEELLSKYGMQTVGAVA